MHEILEVHAHTVQTWLRPKRQVKRKKGQGPRYFKPRQGKGRGRKGAKIGYYQSKFKSKGKRKGNKTNGNPFGRDGKNMLCSLCARPDHLRKECPEIPDNKGQGAHAADEDNDVWQEWQGV